MKLKSMPASQEHGFAVNGSVLAVSEMRFRRSRILAVGISWANSGAAPGVGVAQW